VEGEAAAISGATQRGEVEEDTPPEC